MDRRRSLACLMGGFAASGCRREKHSPAAPHAPATPSGPPPEGLNLAPAEIDPSLEIRSIAGLRPFRPSGFVVRREERDGKVLIHNYGHGGGGITLSWGSSHLAAELAGSLSGAACAVIGGGVMGLSTARLLQLRGARVTLYTDSLPPETTSNIAGAQWWPVSVFDNDKRTPAFEEQYLAAARFSFRYFQRLAGPKWGIRWVPNYYLTDGPHGNRWIDGPGGVLHEMQVGFRDFAPGEHVFSSGYARRFHTMLIEPSTYLAALLAEVQAAGAEIVIRRFASAAEVMALPAAAIFNCTGLGARELFGDTELIPIKGQLSILMPQPRVDYNLISGPYYMFSRGDGLILGGTFDRNRWDTAPDEAVRRWLLQGQREVFSRMRKGQETHLSGRA